MHPPHKDIAAAANAAREHINLRLERWHRRCIYAAFAAALATGVAWLVARYLLRQAGQFGETVHPLEPWAIKLHGASAMAMLFFLGSLMNGHIRRALQVGRNRFSGWTMIAALAVLVLTGYGLYYLAGEADRPLWSALHWIVGLASSLALVLHIALGRRVNRRRRH